MGSSRLSVGLYLHVPFCRCKCDWCAFASEAGAPDAEPWLERIIGQIVVQGDRYRWATVYLGGGTPSLLTPGQLDRLLAAVVPRRQTGAETTVEANPESLGEDHLAVLSARGVTRLSLGIQSFDEAILARHGRPTRKVHLDRARSLVRSWPGRLSLDLMAGLEGQTEAGQHQDLKTALDWEPDHLSFYPLGVEPETPLGRRVARGQARLPADDDTHRWWIEGRRFLEDHGYSAYEVSNFSRPGAESVHNRRYWALEPWLGLGPSAVSFLPEEGRMVYRTESARLIDWMTGCPAVVEAPTALELAKDRLLAGLRRVEGVEASVWEPRIPGTLGRFGPGVGRAGGRLFLTPELFLTQDAFLRSAFAELDDHPEFR